MIDLWLFAHTYDIPRLQNQAMKQLTLLYATPGLLTKDDLKYVWRHLGEPGVGEPLKDLLVLVLVAKLEAPNSTKKVENYEDMAGLTGFMGKLYRALHDWLSFEVPVRQKGKKWGLLLQSAEVQEALKVEEKSEVSDLGAGVGRGNRSRAGCAGRQVPKPFAPGEIIEID